MASTVNVVVYPIPTSAVLMATSKHIAAKCRSENVAFLKCEQNDPNPEKCLDKGQQVTYVFSLTPSQGNIKIQELFISQRLRRETVITPSWGWLKDLHHNCTNAMDSYAGCMYYNTDEFELCGKEQKEFEKACPN